MGMKKFHDWVSFREAGENAPEMTPGGNTPMPLAQTHGQQQPPPGPPGGNPNQQPAGAGGEEEETKLTGQLKRHFDMFMADLGKLNRLNKGKAGEILQHVMQQMQQLGVQKATATNAVRGAY